MPVGRSSKACSYRRLSLSLCGLALVLSACAGEPTVQRGEDAEVIQGGLNRVDHARVDFAYVDPEVDFRRYRQVRLLPLGLDHTEIVQPETAFGTGRSIREEWQLSERDRQDIQGAYSEAMQGAMAKVQHFTVADAPGPEVLAVEAALTRIAPSAAKDDIDARPVGRSRVYTQGAGSTSIALALVDSESGEVLALMKDTRDGQAGAWGLNNRVSNLAEVRRVFGLWARLLAGGLDRLARQSPEEGG